MAYNLQQIAASYNRSYPTTWRHIKGLMTAGKFKKRSPGKQFSERELQQLQRLMDFEYKHQP